MTITCLRLSIVITAFFCNFQVGYSQDKSFGITSGILSTGSHALDFTNTEISATYGLQYNHYFIKGLSATLGLNYEKSSNKFRDNDIITRYNYFLVPTYVSYNVYTFQSLSMPILFRPYIGSKFRLYANVGVNLRYVLHAADIYGYYTEPYQNWDITSNNYYWGKRNLRNEVNKFDAGLLYGLGFEFYVAKKLSIAGDVIANSGLRNMGDKLPAFKYNVISYNLGIRYHLNPSPYFSVEKKKAEIGRIAVYGELLGNSLIKYSMNVLHVVNKNENWHVYYTAGFGYNTAKDGRTNSFRIPASVNLSRQINNHFLESGIGVTYSYHDTYSGNQYMGNIEYNNRLYANVRLGYKYQIGTSGLFFGMHGSGYLRMAEFENDDKSYLKLFALPGISVGKCIK